MARALIAVLVAAMGLAGCSLGSDEEEAASGDGKVALQVFGDAEELAAYREVVAAYRELTGRSVTLVEVPDRDSHLAKLTTAFAAGRPPDVFLVNYRNFGPFYAREAIEAVGPRLEESERLRREQFYPAPLEAFTSGGELQCLPQNASSLVVYFNQDLFRRAGVPLPRGPWTWDEFFRTAIRLRAGLRGATHPVGIDPGLIRLAPFVWTAGGELVDDTERPKRFAFDSPEARRGIDRFLSFYREGLVPTETATEAQPIDETFIAGRLAMFMSSRRDVPALRGIEDFTWDVAPFPSAEKTASVLHSDAFCLARGGDAEDAWSFVEFVGGPEGQRLLARSGRIVPSLRAVAESPDFLESDAPPRSSQVFLDGLPTLRRLPSSANWPRIEDAASLAFKRAFYAELTVEEAVGRIEDETAGLF